MTEYREPGPVTEDELRAEVEAASRKIQALTAVVDMLECGKSEAESRLAETTELLRRLCRAIPSVSSAAEQRVLEAMAGVETETLRTMLEVDILIEPCSAELARRGLSD